MTNVKLQGYGGGGADWTSQSMVLYTLHTHMGKKGHLEPTSSQIQTLGLYGLQF